MLFKYFLKIKEEVCRLRKVNLNILTLLSSTGRTLTKEAFSRGEGLSPADMLVEIARRNFAQATTAGDSLAMKAIIEANKFIEPTADAEVIKENVKDVSTEDLQARVLQLVGNEK